MDKYDVLMNLKRQGTTGDIGADRLTGSTSVAITSRVPPSTTPPTTSNAPSSSTVSTPSPTSPTPAPMTSTPPGTNTGTPPIVTRSSSAANTTPTQESSTTPASTPASATSSTPAPTSRTTTPPTSTLVSPSSAAPTTTTPPPTSSTAPTSSSTPPTSTPATTSSSTPVTSSTPLTSSTAAATTATTPTSTSVQLTPTVIPIGTSSRTTLSVPLATSFIRTTSAGVVYTVTAIVGQPSASASSAAAKKPFLQNTGAVVGVFVVVGVAATALAVFIITLFIRRRRAKAFDREVQDAAREAALTHAPVDDDDYTGNASYNTHASQPMSTERDHRSGYSGGPGAGGGYGSSNASSWDPYGRTAAGAAAGYEMHQRRTSTGTAPGMAGFGAGDTFARNVGADGYNQSQPQPQGYGPAYGQPQQQQAYNNQGYNNQQQQGNRAYNNTSPPQTYQLAQERGPTRAAPQPKMMMPEVQQQQRQNYNTVDAYRPGPSYGQAHPGEQVEYGHAYGGEDLDRLRQSEDPYGGYEGYEYGSNSNHAGGSNAGLPAYAPGSSGAAAATGDRKGAAASIGANLMRQPSAATQYSQDTDGSADERPQKRVLKVANE